MGSCDVGNCPVRLVSKRFVHRAPIFAILFSLLGVGYSSYAWVSLQAGSLPFFWQNPTVTFVIHQDGDPRIGDGSDQTAVRLAFEAWAKIPSSRVAFFEDNSEFSRKRTDWRADDIRLVKWDMTNESGFFGSGTGLVAITPVDFNPSTGEIIDADILFNGSKQFTTGTEGGKFDIQNVATHEVGHFIGLDHSAIVGATMNPFANTGDTRLRTLQLDDKAAATSIYPSGGEPGAIQGYVMRDGKAVSGAHVVAENLDGAPASATLTDGSGFFKIRGLDQGSYAVYAEPLDGPVSNSNFSLHTSNLVIDTNFGTTFYGLTGGKSKPANPDRVNVNFGQTTDIQQINTLPSAGMNLTAVSLTAVQPNSETQLTVFGSGLNSANSVVIPGPPGDGLFASNPAFNTSSVRVELSVSSSVMPQLRSIRVFNSSNDACAILTGGFEIRLPGPLMEGLSAATGAPGIQVTVNGLNFQLGARVIFGAAVVQTSGSGDAVSFTVPQVVNGSYAVAVENPDGQFAKINNGFTVSGSTVVGPEPGSGGTTQPAPTLSSIPNSGGQVAPPAGGGGSSSSSGGGGGGGCSLDADAGLSGGIPSALFLLLLAGGLLGLRRHSA